MTELARREGKNFSRTFGVLNDLGSLALHDGDGGVGGTCVLVLDTVWITSRTQGFSTYPSQYR